MTVCSVVLLAQRAPFPQIMDAPCRSQRVPVVNPTRPRPWTRLILTGGSPQRSRPREDMAGTTGGCGRGRQRCPFSGPEMGVRGVVSRRHRRAEGTSDGLHVGDRDGCRCGDKPSGEGIFAPLRVSREGETGARRPRVRCLQPSLQTLCGARGNVSGTDVPESG